MNFRDENSLAIEIRVYPYRLAKAGLVFLARLPYRAIFREWRAGSPAASAP